MLKKWNSALNWNAIAGTSQELNEYATTGSK
jgi:hypothetical protein